MRLVLITLLAASAVFCDQRFVSYIDHLTSYWGANSVSKAIGVPGYNADLEYDVINLAFKLSNRAADAAQVWANPFGFMDKNDCPLGKTADEVQKFWRKQFHDQGKKVMVSAFGATDFPTSNDPDTTCTDIA